MLTPTTGLASKSEGWLPHQQPALLLNPEDSRSTTASQPAGQPASRPASQPASRPCTCAGLLVGVLALVVPEAPLVALDQVGRAALPERVLDPLRALLLDGRGALLDGHDPLRRHHRHVELPIRQHAPDAHNFPLGIGVGAPLGTSPRFLTSGNAPAQNLAPSAKLTDTLTGGAPTTERAQKRNRLAPPKAHHTRSKIKGVNFFPPLTDSVRGGLLVDTFSCLARRVRCVRLCSCFVDTAVRCVRLFISPVDTGALGSCVG